MPDRTPTSLPAALVSHTGKIIKNGIVFLKKEKIGILHFAFKLSQSVRNRVSKLKFKQTKNELF